MFSFKPDRMILNKIRVFHIYNVCISVYNVYKRVSINYNVPEVFSDRNSDSINLYFFRYFSDILYSHFIFYIFVFLII